METLEEITRQAKAAMTQLLAVSRTQPGDIVAVGCSSSEVAGEKIGTHSSIALAQAIFDGLYPVIKEQGLYLAAQCCEHLNRALILEHDAARRYALEPVNVIPQPKAGGSFATTAWQRFDAPVAVEELGCGAVCGMDIGGTLIGMHLKKVAVPVRLDIKKIGEAGIICARTRPKFIGGCRAVYDEEQG